MSLDKDTIKAEAERGDNDSQFTLGYMYENNIGFKRDLSNAKEWYKRAAKMDHLDACCNLGHLYEKQKKYSKAFKWYDFAAQRGCTQAQYNLGSLYAQDLGTSKNRNQSLHWYTQATDKGHHDAQANVGYFYWK
jgi:TPR repeat protein